MAKPVWNINTQTLYGNLGTGFIPLSLAQFRIVASNDIGVKNATDGGTVSKDTDPIYERVNGATDKKGRLSWASASVIEIHGPELVYPPDFNNAAPLVVNILAAMKSGSVNTPVIAVGFFEGVGDTNAGGDTAALSTSVQHLTVSIAAADLGAYPKGFSFTLKPGAHATASNDVYIYGAWFTYTRKS